MSDHALASRIDLPPRRHIIDVLIEERAPTLAATPVWPLLRPILYALLSYAKARTMADVLATLPGREALEHISHLLSLRTEITGLDRIPQDGKAVIIANHPTGIADGIALWDAVKARRPDLIFYANADAHRVCPRFGEVLVPVEWELHKRTRERTRETLRLTQEAMQEGRALAIFPAGRLARFHGKALRDPPWMSSAIAIARKHATPVVPVHVSGPVSVWFHAFDKVSKELRDMTLFHELLNKRGGLYRFRVGHPLAPEQLVGDAQAITDALKAHVEGAMETDADATFRF